MARRALHTPAQISAFLDGDPRLIAAAYRDRLPGSPLYVLQDGEAESVREWAKSQLMCPLPGCPAPDLTVVSRFPRRRDGFRHGAGAGNHSAESIHHLQGKAVISQWLASLIGADRVEAEAASDTQRRRVADVMATLPSGQRIAFEIQYASLSVAGWRRRHESYRDQGIVDVWLWGHTRLSDARVPPGGDRFGLTDVLDELAQHSLPVLFINPGRAQVGIGYDWDGEQAVHPYGSSMLLKLSDLGSFGVDTSGISSAALRLINLASLQRRLRLEDEVREQADQKQHLLARLATLFGPALALKQRQELATRRRTTEAMRLRAAQDNARREQRRRAEANAQRLRDQEAADMAARGRRTQCVYCGGILAEVLQERGFHGLCAQRATGLRR